MQSEMPQELEVWYILPSIRKELAKSMINDFGLKQKQAASLLGLTEAAVSQYLKDKRACGIVFSREMLREVKKSAGIIVRNKGKVVQEVMRLCNLCDVKKMLCALHKKRNKSIEKECKICFE
jgi:hypothetical protein